MLEKGKISAAQLALMMYATIVGTVLLSVPSVIGRYAKNDLWISPIWAAMIGMIAVYTAYRLHQFYPKRTIIQYIPLIIGRIPGKLLGLSYLFFYLVMNGHGVRIYADFIVGTSLPFTPMYIIVGSMIIVCCLAVKGGVEGIGRASQIIIPFYFLTFILLIAFLTSDMKLERILPVLEHGLVPTIKGALTPQGWFAETLLISFLLPNLSNGDKAIKWVAISVVMAMLTLVITNLTVLFMYGSELPRLTYPLLSATRYISYANFFENIESIIVAIWVLSNFIKFTIVLYALVLGSAQLFNLSDYRPLVMPIGFLTALISFWSLPSQMDLSEYSTLVWPVYSLLYQTLIPMLLMLVAFIRTRNSKGERSP
ncbi:GerAB/ArcD/ProY family transporter [Cohnella cholangitidis]|uniref:GerAB/ArcD/ProY family transporter n=1 Tax=Cohnella cholangitidis TaxID=2598458 RepID=A0A7G5C690_9BACL|nr:endospore germination permease [Cohnella cholangitidis]QMV44724.1 GerAB/ArcD/ProY family transporter [Cohnella cholangitidis]